MEYYKQEFNLEEHFQLVGYILVANNEKGDIQLRGENVDVPYDEFTEDVDYLFLSEEEHKCLEDVFYRYREEFGMYFLDYFEEDEMKAENVGRAIEIVKAEQEKENSDVKKLALEKLLFMLNKAYQRNGIVSFVL